MVVCYKGSNVELTAAVHVDVPNMMADLVLRRRAARGVDEIRGERGNDVLSKSELSDSCNIFY